MRQTKKENKELGINFPAVKIRHYASLYNVGHDMDMEQLAPTVKKKWLPHRRRPLNLDKWKLDTGRNQHNIKKNEKQQVGIVEDMTRLAFSAKTELGRLECLSL